MAQRVFMRHSHFFSMEVVMSVRSPCLLVGVLLTGLTGCSHHHGSYEHAVPRGDYIEQGSQDVTGGLVENTSRTGNRQAGECGDGRDDRRDQSRLGNNIASFIARSMSERELFGCARGVHQNLDELNNSRMRSRKDLGPPLQNESLLTAEEWTALSRKNSKRYGSRYYGKGAEGSSRAPVTAWSVVQTSPASRPGR